MVGEVSGAVGRDEESGAGASGVAGSVAEGSEAAEAEDCALGSYR